LSAVAYPYLRLKTAGLSPWSLRRDDGTIEPLGTGIEGWDYAADLVLSRTLALDPQDAARALGLGSVRLLVTVVAGTGGPRGDRDRRVVWREETPATLQPRPVDFRLAGADLSQALTLTTEVLLIEGETPSDLSPVEPMTRLWRDTFTAVLDPETRRFPIEATSFAALLPDHPHSAAWFLDWSMADIDRDFTSAVRLYINADQPEFVARVSDSDPPVVQLLMSSVMQQLARGLLDAENMALSLADDTPESLGGVAAGWLRQGFPNQALDTIRALARSNPALFEAALTAAAGPESADA
jgi:hypothetical protein